MDPSHAHGHTAVPGTASPYLFHPLIEGKLYVARRPDSLISGLGIRIPGIRQYCPDRRTADAHSSSGNARRALIDRFCREMGSRPINPLTDDDMGAFSLAGSIGTAYVATMTRCT